MSLSTSSIVVLHYSRVYCTIGLMDHLCNLLNAPDSVLDTSSRLLLFPFVSLISICFLFLFHDLRFSFLRLSIIQAYECFLHLHFEFNLFQLFAKRHLSERGLMLRASHGYGRWMGASVVPQGPPDGLHANPPPSQSIDCSSLALLRAAIHAVLFPT